MQTSEFGNAQNVRDALGGNIGNPSYQPPKSGTLDIVIRGSVNI